jgi:hypothetical protein
MSLPEQREGYHPQKNKWDNSGDLAILMSCKFEFFISLCNKSDKTLTHKIKDRETMNHLAVTPSLG